MLQRSKALLRAVLLAAAVVGLTALAAQAATKVHWYGHSAFMIETSSGGVILIDPWLANPKNPDKDAIAKLTRVDYILVTHGHFDHLGNAVEIGKKTGAILVGDSDMVRNIIGVLDYPGDHVERSGPGGTIDLPKVGGHVTLVPAVHGSEMVVAKPPPGAPATSSGGTAVGFVLVLNDGTTIYHTGDTDVIPAMQVIAKFNKVDLMLVCIGDHFTMGPERAALAVEWVQPKQVVPMHYGTFGLLTGTPAQFKAALDKRGLGGRMVEMQPGETRTF
jgi:L-ascorbate metabolism protein UlaG (beta-lactamase superfamily)